MPLQRESAASETNADVIVMGVAPRTWLDRLLFGSTVRCVLRRADVPVLNIPVMGRAEGWSEDTVEDDPMDGVHSQSDCANRRVTLARRAHREHRARSVTKYPPRRRPEQGEIKGIAASNTEYDQIGAPFFREAQELISR